jgi:hypothetical protein
MQGESVRSRTEVTSSHLRHSIIGAEDESGQFQEERVGHQFFHSEAIFPFETVQNGTDMALGISAFSLVQHELFESLGNSMRGFAFDYLRDGYKPIFLEFLRKVARASH